MPRCAPCCSQGFTANPAAGRHGHCTGAVRTSGSLHSFNICKVHLDGLTGLTPQRGVALGSHHHGIRVLPHQEPAPHRVHRHSSNTSCLRQQLQDRPPVVILPPSISHASKTELLTNVNGSRNQAGSGAEGPRRHSPQPRVHSVHNTVRVFLK